MKIIFLALVFSLIFGISTVFAAPVNITCDPQANVDEYNLFINGDQVATSTAILDVESGLYYLLFDLKTLNLADGDYVATATAKNEWEESGISN
ncbi:unnamed protein product, partial [marine sediment metagenome]